MQEDYFEIDFLDVETKKSGDAICLRYQINGRTYIHVVDGGYQATSEKLIEHIDKYYDSPSVIDNVVVTHNDGDHTGGLKGLFEKKKVLNLWMLRPWLYADVLISRFPTYSSVEYLRSKLRTAYSNLADIEEVALAQEIPINEAFQGTTIGAFTVMAPTKDRFLDLITDSDRTPVTAAVDTLLSPLFKTLQEVAAKMKAAVWGEEYFPPSGTSPENDMSIVQYANLSGKHIVLCGDTGRDGLQELIDHSPRVGLQLPGVDRFQVPHHGGRHNVNSELLDKILGPKLADLPAKGGGHFTSFISSAKEDAAHPRASVVRALWHRGSNVLTTEGKDIRTSVNAPVRAGWVAAPMADYPTEQEE